MVDEAGAIVYGWLRDGGEVGAVLEALGSALLNEDADFHWYQTYEAAVRQAAAWPAGSEPVALILAGTARFLAAHTPTRRELAQVVGSQHASGGAKLSTKTSERHRLLPSRAQVHHTLRQ